MKRIIAYLLIAVMMVSINITASAAGNKVNDDCFKIGGIVGFGSYEQNNNKKDGTEQIEWIILDKQGDYILLLSCYALDQHEFDKDNSSNASITWENSDMRSWLNTTFYKTAFSESERGAIATANVHAVQNPSFPKVNQGNDTEDRIFLLSISELYEYLPNQWDKGCEPTAYAVARGAYLNKNTGNTWWWLRTNGNSKSVIAGVNTDGTVHEPGFLSYYDRGAVRPALWVKYK